MVQMDIIRQAQYYATVKHIIEKKTPQLHGVLPYTHHLEEVAAVLRRFGYTALHLQVGARLHDIMEDCAVKFKELAEMFGESVADLVWSVTDEPGYPNRKTRKAATYPKTRAGGEDSVVLKLADRIANIEAGGSMLDAYRKEQEDFRRALYTPGIAEEMWAHLEKLLFDS
jgi:(p)ppGpp synthase/HD superfamily hydrolase